MSEIQLVPEQNKERKGRGKEEVPGDRPKKENYRLLKNINGVRY